VRNVGLKDLHHEKDHNFNPQQPSTDWNCGL